MKFAQPGVIPPVSLKFASDVALFAPGAIAIRLTVEVTAARPDSAGTLRLERAGGLESFAGETTVPSGATSATGEVDIHRHRAGATGDRQHHRRGGNRRQCVIDNEREEINYPHIPAAIAPAARPAKGGQSRSGHSRPNIGYLPGAGDSVAESLQANGLRRHNAGRCGSHAGQLQGFDAVVIGVRAFNVRTDLVSQLPALFAYVENGGNVIAQYNRPDGLKTDQLAPYNLHLSGDRVTDETAAVTFLAPDHPVLNTPNKITSADFDGWIQERGIYFPDQWDDHFTPILACNDPGEAPLKGGLLVAQYGKGYFVYTGLVFFRELPAGVPGAYRLFANLISLGK